MSSGLMSCVRENSPPLESDDAVVTVSGPLSLPMVNDTCIEIVGERSSTMASNIDSVAGGVGGAAPNAEQQKKRRFHPLRNLRRIFRRRTITNVSDTPARTHMNTLPVPRGAQQVNSTSEKNLRSATLTSMSSVASASSPSSPLTHQQLQDAYNSQSLPKSKTYATGAQLQRDALVLGSNSNGGRGKYQQTLQRETQGETSTDFDITHNTSSTKIIGDMFATRTGVNTSSSSSYHQTQQVLPQRMSMGIGVAVLPPLGGATRGRNFFTERQNLRSIGDSSHELNNSENDSGPSGMRRIEGRSGMHNSSSNSGEITDSQRSLSEGRLVDSDFSREGLSQSHDSVFSESATASSLSIVMRAELANVLRKRTRPDGSEEDLGLPRSPGSPQRRADQSGFSARPTNTTANNTNQSEVSSVSLLSMNSTECEEFQATSTANNSMEQQQTERATRYIRSATFSSMPSEILRHPTMSASFNEGTKDEVDLFSSDWQRLSHAAAKHKMAIRPMKKNVPTRQHRRTIQNSIPEVNEELKASTTNRLEISNAEAKAKSRSLPPGVNAKILEQHAAPDTSKLDKINSTASMATLSKNTDSTITIAPTQNKPTMLSETCSSTTKFTSSSSSSATKIFGLRGFSGKTTTNIASESKKSQATSITTATTTTTTTTTMPTPAAAAVAAMTSSNTVETTETSEGGFLRRLMQRNSKRNYAKANTADELDKNVVSEPKKIPISTSCFEMTSETSIDADEFSLDKSKSAMSYGQSIEEARKGIKREIMNEGKSGLSAILNNYMITSERDVSNGRQESNFTSQAVKPKSGPAARQRYMPQDISSLNPSEKRETISNAIPEQEVLQSTTILHGITSSSKQVMKSSPTKTPYRGKDNSAPQHHFEKKPKIVGLSAFQQKISRSNDSVVRISASSNSLEAHTDDFDDQQAKQRGTVEKSRSFRTYNEERRESTSYVNVHNNMPSLPDLTLNLRVPNYTQQFILNEQKQTASSSMQESKDKCSSLGYEVNDAKQLKKPHTRVTESFDNLTKEPSIMGSIGSYSNINVNNTAAATSIPKTHTTIVTHISPVSMDAKEIKPYTSVSIINTPQKSNEAEFQSYKATVNVIQQSSKRPNSLALNGKTKSEEQLKTSPNAATTPLRGITKTYDESVMNAARISPNLSSSTREIDRKSAPTSSTSPNSFRHLRLSSSLSENLQDTQQQPPSPQQRKTNLPEFMKIQLNHIDQERFTGKSNVVLAKNIKETTTPPKPKTAPRTLQHSEHNTRQQSDERVIITERQASTSEQRESDEVKDSREMKEVTKTVPLNVGVRKNSAELTPKSPTKKMTFITDSPNEEDVVLREKTEATVSSPNKISLQDRMRFFMADMGDKDKKVEDMRNERKKSLSEEVSRRLSTFGRPEEKSINQNRENKPATNSTPPTSPVVAPTAGVTTPPPPENHVILRKKSFGVSSTNSINNNVQKDDSTPELMKVFARRSLKVKDEDIVALADRHLNANSNGKKSTTTVAQSLDSDKENQSSSEEKLDKISVDFEEMNSITRLPNHNLQTTTNQQSNNRNSVADFRNGVTTKANNNTINTNSSNNNNNNGVNKSSLNDKSHLPPIKTSNGFRSTISNGTNNTSNTTNTTERSNVFGIKTTKANTSTNGETTTSNGNNHSYNNNNHANSIKRTYERQSLNIKTLESSNPESPPASVNNKTIERSATISEFKGIDQRRREWELRAKEAFK